MYRCLTCNHVFQKPKTSYTKGEFQEAYDLCPKCGDDDFERIPESETPECGEVCEQKVDLAMQNRCIYCGAEHYTLNVWSISHGDCPCEHCGRMAPVLTPNEYANKLAEFYEKQAT